MKGVVGSKKHKYTQSKASKSTEALKRCNNHPAGVCENHSEHKRRSQKTRRRPGVVVLMRNSADDCQQAVERHKSGASEQIVLLLLLKRKKKLKLMHSCLHIFTIECAQIIFSQSTASELCSNHVKYN